MPAKLSKNLNYQTTLETEQTPVTALPLIEIEPPTDNRMYWAETVNHAGMVGLARTISGGGVALDLSMSNGVYHLPFTTSETEEKWSITFDFLYVAHFFVKKVINPLEIKSLEELIALVTKVWSSKENIVLQTVDRTRNNRIRLYMEDFGWTEKQAAEFYDENKKS